MTGPDPQREPHSETEEKKGILKTHEEYIGENEPSMTKQAYEKQKERQRKQEREREKPAGNSGNTESD